jgi:hypothetical protein
MDTEYDPFGIQHMGNMFDIESDSSSNSNVNSNVTKFTNDDYERDRFNLKKLQLLKRKDFSNVMTFTKLRNETMIKYATYLEDLLSRVERIRDVIVKKMVKFVNTNKAMNERPVLNFFKDVYPMMWSELIQITCWPRKKLTNLIASETLDNLFLTKINKYTPQEVYISADRLNNSQELRDTIYIELRCAYEILMYPALEKLEYIMESMEDFTLDELFADPDLDTKDSLLLKETITKFTQETTEDYLLSEYDHDETFFNSIKEQMIDKIESQRAILMKRKAETAINSRMYPYTYTSTNSNLNYNTINNDYHRNRTGYYGYGYSYSGVGANIHYTDRPEYQFYSLRSKLEKDKYSVLTDISTDPASLAESLVVFGLAKTMDEFFEKINKFLTDNKSVVIKEKKLEEHFKDLLVKDSKLTYEEYCQEILNKKFPSNKEIEVEFIYNVISCCYNVPLTIMTSTASVTIDNSGSDNKLSLPISDKTKSMFKPIVLGNYGNFYVPLTQITGNELKLQRYIEI